MSTSADVALDISHMTMSAQQQRRVASAVVRLFTILRIPNHAEPWRASKDLHGTGCGCIFVGRRILTCAHVVQHALQVEVQRVDQTRRYVAHVRHVDAQRELALLTVDDETFYVGACELELAQLPALGSPVSLFGFELERSPELASSRGAVTRVESRTYGYSRRHLLTIETDARGSMGFSGGPAVVGDRLAGIVFQELDARTHVVPSPTISSFLADAENGTIDGVPDLGVYWQKLDNPALRAYLGMDAPRSGVLVSRVVYGSSAWSILESGDVITAIDGVVVNTCGLAMVDGFQMHFAHLVARRQIGESLDIQVIRAHRELGARLVLKPFVGLVPPPRPECPPRYLIVAGLVFVPLTYEFIAASAGGNFHRALFSYKYHYYSSFPNEHRRELVVLARVIEHDVNVGYRGMYSVILDKVNGISISQLSDVSRALLSPVNGYHIFEIDNEGERGGEPDAVADYGRLIILDAEMSEHATRAVLFHHGIECDRRM